MNTTVSVLIPVYNTAADVAACLDSIVSQTFRDLEIIVVNDCTPDNAMDIVNKYAETDDRIKIVNHERNLGLMMARRTGYVNATGDYIVFVDSDDTLPVDSIEKRLEFIRNNDCDFVTSGITYIWPHSNRERLFLPKHQGVFSKHEIFDMLLNVTVTHNLVTAIFPARIFRDREYETLPNHIMGEDLLLFYQIVDRCDRIGVMRSPVYNYVQRPESATNARASEKTLREHVLCWNTQYGYFKRYGFTDEKIFRRIMPDIAYIYFQESAPEIYKGLRPEIADNLTVRTMFSSLSLKQFLSYLVLDKTVYLARALRWLFSKYNTPA